MPAVVPVVAAPIAETVVHAGDATMQSMVKRAGVKPTTVETAAMETATVETATVASTSAMRSVGEIWLGERSNAQHGGCGASQSPSDPGPGAVFG
jgi:hypothetical protein